MEKVTLFCLAAERQASLTALRTLGLLHIRPVSEPEGKALDEIRRQHEHARHLLSLLDAAVAGAAAARPVPQRGPEELLASIDAVHRAQRQVEEHLGLLEDEADRVRPFGHFDRTQLDRIRAAGLHLRLFHDPVDQPVPNSDEIDPDAFLAHLEAAGVAVRMSHHNRRKPYLVPKGTRLFLIAQDNDGTWFFLASTHDFTFHLPEQPFPDRTLAQVEAEQATLRKRKADLDQELVDLAAHRGQLAEYVSQLAERCDFEQASQGMGATEHVAYLQGYCPQDRVPALRQAAAEHGWGLRIQAPAADDQVPTLIRHPNWVRPLAPLLWFLGITPGYREIDVSPSFFIFLTIFLGIIIGDGGYGAIMLALLWFFRRKLAEANPAMFRLLNIFSVATLTWGILSGNYFGIRPETLPAVATFLRIDWLLKQENSMVFCLFLGAVHLSIAHGWRSLTLAPDRKAVAQLGWIGMVWTMFFLSRYLLVALPAGQPFTVFPVIPLLVISLGVVAWFMAPWKQIKTEWIGFATLPQDVIGAFGDIMSYLRLFALGIAGVKVAEAFNAMAAMIGYDGMKWLGAVAVLVFGHALNMILCAMSVLVHGVRLNALEFSLHMGLEWSGQPYKPFAGRTLSGTVS